MKTLTIEQAEQMRENIKWVEEEDGPLFEPPWFDEYIQTLNEEALEDRKPEHSGKC